MATIASKFITGQLPTVCGDCAGDEIVNDYFVDLTVGQMLINNIIDIGVLPANHTIAAAILLSDDIDTGAAVSLDVGILSGTPGDLVSVRTMGAEIFAADVAARTGVASSATLASSHLIRATGADRSIGVKFVAAPATPVAGRVRLRVRMFPSDPNVQF